MNFIKYRTSFLNGIAGVLYQNGDKILFRIEGRNGKSFFGKNFADMEEFEDWWDALPGSGLGRFSALIDEINQVEKDEAEYA